MSEQRIDEDHVPDDRKSDEQRPEQPRTEGERQGSDAAVIEGKIDPDAPGRSVFDRDSDAVEPNEPA